MTAFVLILLSVVGLASSQTFPFPPCQFENNGHPQITISGFSSGGNFAQQLAFSYPNLFSGIGVFSHTFYRCGPGNGKVIDFDRSCTLLQHNATEGPRAPYDPERAHADIREYVAKGLIGNPSCLKNKKLYVNTPLRSFVYSPAQSLSILKVWERYIQNAKTIKTRVQDSPLVVPTNNNFGPPCSMESDVKYAYLGNCGFSGAFDALNFLLEDRAPVEPRSDEPVHLQPLLEFDQEEFTREIENHNLDKVGFFYIPSACHFNRGQCLVHFYFHGCRTGREHQGMNHILHSGFLEVAELNNIIMVFPQAASSLPENASGCWDSFGIGGPLYGTRKGPQIRAVRRMIERTIGFPVDDN